MIRLFVFLFRLLLTSLLFHIDIKYKEKENILHIFHVITYFLCNYSHLTGVCVNELEDFLNLLHLCELFAII